MRYYIASGLENAEQVKKLKKILDDAGWTHTYDWTVHGSVQSDGVARIAEVAEAEVLGVLDAEVVIVLLPGGRGTHVELGLALGQWEVVRPRIVLYSPDPEAFSGTSGTTCAFYHHGDIEQFTSWDVMLEALDQENQ